MKNTTSEKVVKSESEWRKQLTDEQYRVAREAGTERAFTGKYWNNHVLECAQAGDADYIVTGNIRHFPRIWQKTRVVTPREFIDAWTAAPPDYR